MTDTRDILFGQIALERGLITQAQLDGALAKQDGGDQRQIGMLLLEDETIDESELDLVLDVQRERLARTAENSELKLSDILYGRLVAARKLATQGQVSECLREQAKLESMGMFLRLGEILVKKGYLTQEAADEIGAYQREQLSKLTPPEGN